MFLNIANNFRKANNGDVNDLNMILFNHEHSEYSWVVHERTSSIELCEVVQCSCSFYSLYSVC